MHNARIVNPNDLFRTAARLNASATHPRVFTRTFSGFVLTCLLVVAAATVPIAHATAGALGQGDEQLASGEYFDRVTFSGNAGDEVLLEVSSTDFDPYLIVLDPTGNPVAQQDDSALAGTNVNLTFVLPVSGTYTLVITSAMPGETGGYRVSLSAPGQGAAAPQIAKPQQAGQPTQSGAAAGTVSGTVVDSLGRPIEGARVMVVPALTTGSVEVTTDANGRYLVEGLLDVPYRIRAWAFYQHGGSRVCLRLGMESQVHYDTFVTSSGMVKNFSVQHTGGIGDLRDTDEQFGAVLSVMNTYTYEGFGNRIELAFTPTGPLIDGAPSEPFVRVIDPDTEYLLRGLPVAPYTVTATLIEEDGTRSPIGVSRSDFDEPTSSLAVNWQGDGSCSLGSGVEWQYLYLGLPL